MLTKHYVLVQDDNINDFQNRCHTLVDQGYSPIGNLTIWTRGSGNNMEVYYCQSFYLPPNVEAKGI